MSVSKIKSFFPSVKAVRTVLLFVITMHPWRTGCNLCVWEVSLTNARSPWWPVGALAGEGLCPPGEGLCLLVGPCLPAVWWLGLALPIPFVSFTVRVMPLAHKHFLFSLLLSGVYQCISLLPGYTYTHTVSRYLPSKEKKLLNSLEIVHNLLKLVQNVLKIGRKLSINA